MSTTNWDANIAQIYTAQKMEFSIEDFFSKCDYTHRNLRIWSHLLKKSSMENFIFVQCISARFHIEKMIHPFHATGLCHQWHEMDYS